MDRVLASILNRLGLSAPKIGPFECVNPSDGSVFASIALDDAAQTHNVVDRVSKAFLRWREVPAPKRGELVREMGEVLRRHKDTLAELVTLEVGKGVAEARGEVQEMIDICDYAAGMSRSIGGSTLFSERANHRMFEQWHPLGPVLCISAFNFPVAVWAWNAALALICGDPILWKPSLKAPLCAYATHELLAPIFAAAGHPDVLGLALCVDDPIAKSLVADPRFPLVSATGSCAMGKAVAPVVAQRMGRSLLELGGNNAIIVDRSANLELASRAVLFGAAGTAGQRCTTTRRLFVEESVYDTLVKRLVAGYEQLKKRIGPASDPANLVGPLIDQGSVDAFKAMIAQIRASGGEILAGGNALECPGFYVEPTLVKIPGPDFGPMAIETFAPILYVGRFKEGHLDEAIGWQNQVEQGLSSALFSDSVRAMERFLSPAGSDCGIANINIGTSGAEIGGAFGGEKATGGGREAGSDSWKAYMRRQTCTINGSDALPLAQGIVWE
jgi:aldehyde dehydrogenase (NAD+)